MSIFMLYIVICIYIDTYIYTCVFVVGVEEMGAGDRVGAHRQASNQSIRKNGGPRSVS